MIGYCPLEEDNFVRTPSTKYIPPPPPSRKPVEEPGFLDGENSECNYLVLFFILGVFVLAGTDMVKN
jgi:hypothetical protein